MTKKPSITEQINLLRKASVAAFVLLAAAAAALMSGASQQLRWFYQTSDSLANQNGATFTNGSRFIADVPYKVALISVLLLAALFAAVVFTKYQAAYDRAVKNRVVGFRWMWIAVTAALMMVIVAMVNGVQNILILKLLAGTIITTALLSWIAERDNKAARKPVWTAFALSVFTGALPWLAIASVLIGTALYGGVRLPWYAYVLDAVTLVSFAAIATNQYLGFKKYKQWKDYLTVERNYLAIGLVMKIAFAAVLILGFKR